MQRRFYEISGREEDLDALEKALRHIEYLGNVGASRNILIRVDGDGSGRIHVLKAAVDPQASMIMNKIDNDEYNIKQGIWKTQEPSGATVGVYDIG